MRVPVAWTRGSIPVMDCYVDNPEINNLIVHMVMDEFMPHVVGPTPHVRMTPGQIIDTVFETYGPHPALLDLGFTIH